MRRLARHLFTLCSAVSLLLCVAVCVLWVRSFFLSDGVERYTSGPANAGVFFRVRYVRSEHGGIILRDFTQYLTDPASVAVGLSRGPAWEVRADPIAGGPYWDTSSLAKLLDFGVESDRMVLPQETRFVRGVRIPYWALALAAATPPVWWLIRRYNARRRERRAQGWCLHCGYDLRASPGRCPECGAVPCLKSGRANGDLRDLHLTHGRAA